MKRSQRALKRIVKETVRLHKGYRPALAGVFELNGTNYVCNGYYLIELPKNLNYEELPKVEANPAFATMIPDVEYKEFNSYYVLKDLKDIKQQKDKYIKIENTHIELKWVKDVLELYGYNDKNYIGIYNKHVVIKSADGLRAYILGMRNPVDYEYELKV